MRSPDHFRERRCLAQLAFSLVEVLVVIALLSLIIIGLVAMFGQVQRAYKLGMTQVDVLEGGRAVTDMMTRELSQMTPTGTDWRSNAINFYARLRPYTPLYQALPGTTGIPGRTNLLEEVFFMTHENQRWNAVGYFVRTNLRSGTALGFPNEGLGTLYRFETNYTDAQFRARPSFPWEDFNFALTNDRTATKLIDGVVHFKMRAFDTNGVWMNRTNMVIANTWSVSVPDEMAAAFFYSNAVPASVEIELGILEERAAERARSITSPTARYNHLTNEAGKVHLFRWRVPVRNVDPTAYQ